MVKMSGLCTVLSPCYHCRAVLKGRKNDEHETIVDAAFWRSSRFTLSFRPPLQRSAFRLRYSSIFEMRIENSIDIVNRAISEHAGAQVRALGMGELPGQFWP